MNSVSDRVSNTVTQSHGLSPATALTAALEPALTEVARAHGRAAVLVSLSVDFAQPSEGETLQVEAWVTRAARTLVFASAEARRSDGALVGSASGVFRVDEGGF